MVHRGEVVDHLEEEQKGLVYLLNGYLIRDAL